SSSSNNNNDDDDDDEVVALGTSRHKGRLSLIARYIDRQEMMNRSADHEPTVSFEEDLSSSTHASSLSRYSSCENLVSPTYKVTKQRWLILFALLSVALISNLSSQSSCILDIWLKLLGIELTTMSRISQSINMISVVFALPIARLIDTQGLRFGMNWYAIMVCLQNITRGLAMSPQLPSWSQLKLVYWIINLILAMIGTIVFWCLPLKVSELWFPVSERSTAWVLPITACDVGGAIATYMLPLFVTSTSTSYLYGYVNFAFALVAIIIVPVCVTQSKPDHPPSERALRSTNMKVEFLKSLRLVLTSKNYCLHLFFMTIHSAATYSFAGYIEDILAAAGYDNKFCGRLLSLSQIASIVLILTSSAFVSRVTNITLGCKILSAVTPLAFGPYVYSLQTRNSPYLIYVMYIIYLATINIGSPNYQNMSAQLGNGIVLEGTNTTILVMTSTIVTNIVAFIFIQLREFKLSDSNNNSVSHNNGGNGIIKLESVKGSAQEEQNVEETFQPKGGEPHRWLLLIAFVSVGWILAISDQLTPILNIMIQLLGVDVKTYVFINQISSNSLFLASFLFAYYIDKWGIEFGIWFVVALTVIQNVFRALLLLPTLKLWHQLRMFYYVATCSLNMLVLVAFFCLPLKISEMWFPESERAIAWVLMICSFELGTMLSAYGVPILVSDIFSTYKYAYVNLILAAVLIGITALCVHKSKPNHPPSERAFKSLSRTYDYLAGLKIMAHNNDFRLHILFMSTNIAAKIALLPYLQDILAASGYDNQFCGTLMAIQTGIGIVALLVSSAFMAKIKNITLACRLSALLSLITFVLFIASLRLRDSPNTILIATAINQIVSSCGSPIQQNMLAHLSNGVIGEASVSPFISTGIVLISAIMTTVSVSLSKTTSTINNCVGKDYSASLLFVGVGLAVPSLLYMIFFHGNPPITTNISKVFVRTDCDYKQQQSDVECNENKLVS
ncbi:Solute carrier family 49 member A3, partial [Fragariocoptes setiger]